MAEKTKDAKQNVFINYSGKAHAKFREFGIPEELSLVAPYFREIAYQIYRDFNSREGRKKLKDGARQKLIARRVADGANEKDAEQWVDDLEVYHKGLYDQIIDNSIQSLYRKKIQPYMVSMENHLVAQMPNTQEIGLYFSGTSKKKKKYYADFWANVRGIITWTEHGSKIIRLLGPQGAGKTESAGKLAEEGMTMGYPLYTNLPVEPVRKGNIWGKAYTVTANTDYFVNFADLPSVLTVNDLVRELQITLAYINLMDERGLNMERYSASWDNVAEASKLQIGRHVAEVTIRLGVMDDVGEVLKMQGVRIFCRARNTGRWRNGMPEREYSWAVLTRSSKDENLHDSDYIYGIPAMDGTFFKIAWKNNLKLSGPVIPDMNIVEMFDTMVKPNMDDEKVLEVTQKYARERRMERLEKMGLKDERDQKLNQHVARCYDCGNSWMTISAKERPTCSSCKGNNTTTDPATVSLIYLAEQRGKGTDPESIEEMLKEAAHKVGK